MGLLRWTWCLPQTIVSRLARAIVPGTREARAGAVVVRTRWMKDLGGVCLGDTILVTPFASEELVAHEWGHFRQSLLLGPLYYLVIGLPSVTHALWFRRWGSRKPHRYFHFYTEAWADAWGGVYDLHAHEHAHWTGYALVPALAVLVPLLAWRAFGHALGFPLTDVDALADVAFARHPLAEQLLAPLTGGYGKDNAAFWRPVAMLQFWAQRRLFGWDATGWQAWDLALHVVDTWLVAAFANGSLRAAGHPRARALTVATAVLFAAHPLAEEVVPAVARNIDLLLGLGFFGAMVALVHGRRAMFFALATLALGAKEAGVLVPVAAAAWIGALRTDLAPRDRAREIARWTVPLVPVIAAYLAVRAHVLGGLGGYYAAGDLAEHLGAAWERGFLEPLASALSPQLAPLRGVAGVLLTVATWGVLGTLLRPNVRLAVAMAGMYVPWIALLDVTATYSRRVLYVPTAALCVLVVVAAAEAARRRHAIGLGVCAALAAAWAWGSPAVVRYDDWAVSGAVATVFTRPDLWTDLPAGTTVYLVDRPSRIDVDPRRDRLWSKRRSMNNCVAGYAIQAWADERFPGMTVHNLTSIVAEAPLDDDAATVTREGDVVTVTRRPVTRVELEPPGARATETDGVVRIEPDRPDPAAILVWSPDRVDRVWPWPAR